MLNFLKKSTNPWVNLIYVGWFFFFFFKPDYDGLDWKNPSTWLNLIYALPLLACNSMHMHGYT